MISHDRCCSTEVALRDRRNLEYRKLQEKRKALRDAYRKAKEDLDNAWDALKEKWSKLEEKKNEVKAEINKIKQTFANDTITDEQFKKGIGKDFVDKLNEYFKELKSYKDKKKEQSKEFSKQTSSVDEKMKKSMNAWRSEIRASVAYDRSRNLLNQCTRLAREDKKQFNLVFCQDKTKPRPKGCCENENSTIFNNGISIPFSAITVVATGSSQDDDADGPLGADLPEPGSNISTSPGGPRPSTNFNLGIPSYNQNTSTNFTGGAPSINTSVLSSNAGSVPFSPNGSGFLSGGPVQRPGAGRPLGAPFSVLSTGGGGSGGGFGGDRGGAGALGAPPIGK